MYRRQVVVVENEALLRDLIAQTLENHNFQVTTAANVADARRAFSAMDPDAVVVDIELGPGPNGFDFADFVYRTAPDVGIVFTPTSRTRGLLVATESPFPKTPPICVSRNW
ncbi:MAG: response regulator transcription factor [Micrococcales bacterium]